MLWLNKGLHGLVLVVLTVNYGPSAATVSHQTACVTAIQATTGFPRDKVRASPEPCSGTSGLYS